MTAPTGPSAPPIPITRDRVSGGAQQEAKVDHISTGGRWVILSKRPISAETAARIRATWNEWRADPESRPAVLGELTLVDLKTGREYPTPEGRAGRRTRERHPHQSAGHPGDRLPRRRAGHSRRLLIGAALGLARDEHRSPARPRAR